MSKPWIIVIFVLWTIVLLLAVPFIFSFSTQHTFKSAVGNSNPTTLVITESRPILDWTGRLTSLTKVEAVSGNDILISVSPQKYNATLNWTSEAEQGAAANP